MTGAQDVEIERLAALHALGLLDTPAEPRFDRITALAARLLDVPVSLVSLIDRDRQWNKSVHGTGDTQMSLRESFCRHVVKGDAPLVVPDLAADARFADNPYVLSGARFYAGWPLRDGRGLPLGALCLLGDTPRQLTAAQRELMESLAEWAQAELNAASLGQALRQVRDTQRYLLKLLDEAPACVLLTTLDGTVEWFNTPANRLFWTDGQPSLTGRPLASLLPTLRMEDFAGQGRRADDAPGANRRSMQAGVRPDGRRFRAELTVSVAEVADGRRYVVFVRDLEQDQDGQAQLSALRERTEVVFDALAEGVIGIDVDGLVSFVNIAAAQLLQRRRSDLLGQSWHAVLHADRCPREPCDQRDALALAGRTLSGVELRRADGSTLPVQLTVRMLRAGDGAAGVVMTVIDLTDRMRVERIKNELVSVVSHELRTPLTSIRGSLGLLRSGVIDPGSDKGARMIEVATESTDRLSRLVNDILDLERLQDGKVELVLGRHRASALMLSAAQAVSGAAVAAGLTIDVLDGEARVLADADRAVQVLVNLLGNAIKFAPAGSTVTMSVETVGDRVHLLVADKGRGIPADQLGRVFDRFAQVDGGDTREFQGTGLGLAIAQGLARQHGGDLSATSTVGVGSTFRLVLPVAPGSRRLLAFTPAERVPHELSSVLAGRGWAVVALRSTADLAGSAASAVLAATSDPEVERQVRATSAALRLPLVVLTTAGAPFVAASTQSDETSLNRSLLLVVADDDLAAGLTAGFERRGVQVTRATRPQTAVQAVQVHEPDLVLVDLRLTAGDGFAVVEQLRHPSLPPTVVYSVLQLDGAERRVLQGGPTSSLAEGRDRIEDVVSDAVTLLRGIRPDPHLTAGDS